jgi:TRAP-type C4-dicarboxylate transport system permease small subunit
MFVLELFIQILFIVFAVFVVAMSVHLNEEKRQERRIALPWEEGFSGWAVYLFGSWGRKATSVFDKSKVKYFDGDNT